MSCWISDLLDFAKFTANPKSFFIFRALHAGSPTCLTLQSIFEVLLFLHKQIITQFSFFSIKIAHYSKLLQGPMPEAILFAIFLKLNVVSRSTNLTTFSYN